MIFRKQNFPLLFSLTIEKDHKFINDFRSQLPVLHKINL